MKRFLAHLCAALALVLWAGAAAAQHGNMLWSGQAVASGGGSPAPYVGPEDVAGAATFWGGLRCSKAANASAAQAIRIRRASDDAETDIGLTADCALDVTTAGTHCASTTCFVTTLYDQSGNSRNFTQSTAANQPQLIFSCKGSLPCMRFDGTSDLMTRTSWAVANPSTVVTEVKRRSDPGLSVVMGNNGGSSWFAGLFTNTAYVFAGSGSPTLSPAATENNWHRIQYLFNGSSSGGKINGNTSTAVNPGTQAFAASATASIGAAPAPGSYCPCDIGEVGLWSGDATSAGMDSNLSGYWGT